MNFQWMAPFIEGTMELYESYLECRTKSLNLCHVVCRMLQVTDLHSAAGSRRVIRKRANFLFTELSLQQNERCVDFLFHWPIDCKSTVNTLLYSVLWRDTWMVIFSCKNIEWYCQPNVQFMNTFMLPFY